jgi:uncharacterized protein
MRRFALGYLKDWKTRPNRKPLILRGARQAGKSYLLRSFAKTEELDLLEINLIEYLKRHIQSKAFQF